MIKTTAQTIEVQRFNKEKYGTISLEDYKTEAILIHSDVVARQNAKLNMYDIDELRSYLIEKAITIVEKFNPASAKNGWKDLGSFLHFTLPNHAKNFNQQYFNYLKGITPMVTNLKESENLSCIHEDQLTGACESYEWGYEDVEFFADNVLGELLELLTPRQKFILKGRLDLKNNVEIASELGTTKMTIGRDLKKIQEIATTIGIAI